MNHDDPPSFDMLVMGASGDLARRTLLPSLYYLQKEDLAAHGRIFALARQPLSRVDFLARLDRDLARFVADQDLVPEVVGAFRERLQYVQLSATEPKTYAELAMALDPLADRPRIFYLAIPPSLFGECSRAIAAAGLVNDQSRIVLEKPIGLDLSSAMAINTSVGEAFAEHQIYRIDHYLGKETVQNLTALRFSNGMNIRKTWWAMLCGGKSTMPPIPHNIPETATPR